MNKLLKNLIVKPNSYLTYLPHYKLGGGSGGGGGGGGGGGKGGGYINA